MTLPRHDVGTSRRCNVVTSLRWYVATLGVSDSNVMSSHFVSHHITSQHRNVATFWVRMNNVVTFLANVVTLLEIYEQRLDVGHEHCNVAGFSNDKKVAKIQSLGLLHTSKLFLIHINHLRSSHDHIQKEQYWIYTFSFQKFHFRNFEKYGYQKLKTLNIKPILMHTRLL